MTMSVTNEGFYHQRSSQCTFRHIHDVSIIDLILATRQRSLDERDGQFDLGGLPISSRSGFTTRPVPERHALRIADRSSGRVRAGELGFENDCSSSTQDHPAARSKTLSKACKLANRNLNSKCANGNLMA